MKALKVFDIKDGEPFFLFNSLNGTRKVPLNRWITAEKRAVRDAIGPYYQSGFHAFPNASDITYWLRWVTHTDNRVVVEVEIKEIRPKSHGRGNVQLADKMIIRTKAWKNKKPLIGFLDNSDSTS